MSTMTYWLWLALKEGVGLETKHWLLDRFGDPMHIFALSREELAADTELTAAQCEMLSDHSLKQAEEVENCCRRRAIRILCLEDAEYPMALRQIEDAPLVLYVRGTLPDLEWTPGVAVVGTRKATSYGLAQAERFGAGLTRAGFTVISGMALGGDGAAARGALRAGGKTIAVLANGVDICYPPAHQRLMGDILLSGAVISENPPGTRPEKQLFPRRNRIISGLAAAVLVVEAPIRSGTSITVRHAKEQGRQIFAIPGALDNPNSEGCNRMIRDGDAALVTSPADIAHELAELLPEKTAGMIEREVFEREAGTAREPQISAESLWEQIMKSESQHIEHGEKKQAAEQPKKKMPDNLEPDALAVVQAVSDGAQETDAIIEKTGLETARVMSLLTTLELEGVLTGENGRIEIV